MGYLVRVLVGDLGATVHIVGLTATSPQELTGEEAERHVRFDELIDSLHDDTTAVLASGPWVIGRIRHRDTGDGHARVPFATRRISRLRDEPAHDVALTGGCLSAL